MSALQAQWAIARAAWQANLNSISRPIGWLIAAAAVLSFAAGWYFLGRPATLVITVAIVMMSLVAAVPLTLVYMASVIECGLTPRFKRQLMLSHFAISFALPFSVLIGVVFFGAISKAWLVGALSWVAAAYLFPLMLKSPMTGTSIGVLLSGVLFIVFGQADAHGQSLSVRLALVLPNPGYAELLLFFLIAAGFVCLTPLLFRSSGEAAFEEAGRMRLTRQPLKRQARAAQGSAGFLLPGLMARLFQREVCAKLKAPAKKRALAHCAGPALYKTSWLSMMLTQLLILTLVFAGLSFFNPKSDFMVLYIVAIGPLLGFVFSTEAGITANASSQQVLALLPGTGGRGALNGPLLRLTMTQFLYCVLGVLLPWSYAYWLVGSGPSLTYLVAGACALALVPLASLRRFDRVDTRAPDTALRSLCALLIAAVVCAVLVWSHRHFGSVLAGGVLLIGLALVSQAWRVWALTRPDSPPLLPAGRAAG